MSTKSDEKFEQCLTCLHRFTSDAEKLRVITAIGGVRFVCADSAACARRASWLDDPTTSSACRPG